MKTNLRTVDGIIHSRVFDKVAKYPYMYIMGSATRPLFKIQEVIKTKLRGRQVQNQHWFNSKQVTHYLIISAFNKLCGNRIIGNNDSSLGGIQDIKFCMKNNLLSSKSLVSVEELVEA